MEDKELDKIVKPGGRLPRVVYIMQEVLEEQRRKEVRSNEEGRGNRDLGETSRGIPKCNRGGGEKIRESKKGGETHKTGD